MSAYQSPEYQRGYCAGYVDGHDAVVALWDEIGRCHGCGERRVRPSVDGFFYCEACG